MKINGGPIGFNDQVRKHPVEPAGDPPVPISKEFHGRRHGPLLTLMLETMQHLIGYRFDDFAPRDRIARVKAPVLIVHGADDDVVPIGSLHELSAAQPDAETLIVPDARHSDLTPFEPRVGEITDFLDRNLLR